MKTFCPKAALARKALHILLSCACSLLVLKASASTSPKDAAFSPASLALSPDNQIIYVGCATGDRILALDAQSGNVIRTLLLPAPPVGMVLSTSGKELYVTCAAAESTLVT